MIESFAPIYDKNCRVLILGSCPSLQSLAKGEYYGNRQNRFWRVMFRLLGEEYSDDYSVKTGMLLRHGVALWDVVLSCTIAGSSDASIERETVADVASLVKGSGICRILCNGTTAYRLFAEHFLELVPIAKKLPSTSPANPRFCPEPWIEALREGFSEGAVGADEARSGHEEMI